MSSAVLGRVLALGTVLALLLPAGSALAQIGAGEDAEEGSVQDRPDPGRESAGRDGLRSPEPRLGEGELRRERQYEWRDNGQHRWQENRQHWWQHPKRGGL